MNIPPPAGQPIAWMQKSQLIPGAPVGLEYLSQIDQLQVEQKNSLTEIITDWDKNNKYCIYNGAGQQCYFAIEETDMCMRQCCGNNRGFVVKILDNRQQEVMRITRDFKCLAGCCWCAGCCAWELKIEVPAQLCVIKQYWQIVGYVRQKGSLWRSHYDVLDEFHEPIHNILGPSCICDGSCCPCDNEFKVVTLTWTGTF